VVTQSAAKIVVTRNSTYPDVPLAAMLHVLYI
jgi:hypothetical protein